MATASVLPQTTMPPLPIMDKVAQPQVGLGLSSQVMEAVMQHQVSLLPIPPSTPTKEDAHITVAELSTPSTPTSPSSSDRDNIILAIREEVLQKDTIILKPVDSASPLLSSPTPSPRRSPRCRPRSDSKGPIENLLKYGTSIVEIRAPTAKIYTPLLKNNSRNIYSTKRSEHSYGPHPRQKLDLYYPPPTEDENPRAPPVLIFIYGGGFIRGSKRFNGDAEEDFVYANFGHFYASRGFAVIVADYRLAGPPGPPTKTSFGGGHGAKFPDGGEDVSMVVNWASENLCDFEGQTDLFLMGASAGGAHVATFMLHPKFSHIREKVREPSRNPMRLKGVIYVSAMLSVNPNILKRSLSPGVQIGVSAYYDKDKDKWPEMSPEGLLRSAQEKSQTTAPELSNAPSSLVLTATLDPALILEANTAFTNLWEEERMGPLETGIVEGHNHLSSLMGLGTGLAVEEEWGLDVLAWMKECSRA